MSQSKPTKLFVQRNASKVNNLTLSSVLLLAIAVGIAGVEANNQPEGTIERPSNRAATAFVPRLGKRLAGMNSRLDGSRVDSLGRLLCSNSQDCNQLVLLGALVRGIAVQDGDLNLVASGGQFDDSTQTPFDTTNDNGLALLQMIQRDQMLRRQTRASLDGPDELTSVVGGGGSLSSGGKFAGAKRVAFTPRIGRRR